MKKISTTTSFELNESGPENLKSYNLPFIVERKEYDNEITWFGYNINWKFENNQWYILKHNEWLECDIPYFEKIYLKNYQQ
jgi:hypothetical protein